MTIKSDCCGADYNRFISTNGFEYICDRCNHHCHPLQSTHLENVSKNAEKIDMTDCRTLNQRTGKYEPSTEAEIVRAKDLHEYLKPETTKNTLRRLEAESGWNEPVKLPWTDKPEHPGRWPVHENVAIAGYALRVMKPEDLASTRGYILQLEAERDEWKTATNTWKDNYCQVEAERERLSERVAEAIADEKVDAANFERLERELAVAKAMMHDQISYDQYVQGVEDENAKLKAQVKELEAYKPAFAIVEPPTPLYTFRCPICGDGCQKYAWNGTEIFVCECGGRGKK